jgi:hypothetical protein
MSAVPSAPTALIYVLPRELRCEIFTLAYTQPEFYGVIARLLYNSSYKVNANGTEVPKIIDREPLMTMRELLLCNARRALIDYALVESIILPVVLKMCTRRDRSVFVSPVAYIERTPLRAWLAPYWDTILLTQSRTCVCLHGLTGLYPFADIQTKTAIERRKVLRELVQCPPATAPGNHIEQMWKLLNLGRQDLESVFISECCFPTHTESHAAIREYLRGAPDEYHGAAAAYPRHVPNAAERSHLDARTAILMEMILDNCTPENWPILVSVLKVVCVDPSLYPCNALCEGICCLIDSHRPDVLANLLAQLPIEIDLVHVFETLVFRVSNRDSLAFWQLFFDEKIDEIFPIPYMTAKALVIAHLHYNSMDDDICGLIEEHYHLDQSQRFQIWHEE